MTKRCTQCGCLFTREWGRSSICKLCMNKNQREYRKRINNSNVKRYEKTINGYIMRMYSNMKCRITGVQKNRYKYYKGKYLLPKRIFYLFAVRNKKFIDLYKQYRKSGYIIKLAPSINRIDSDKGYSLDNMEFITQSENSRLAGMK